MPSRPYAFIESCSLLHFIWILIQFLFLMTAYKRLQKSSQNAMYLSSLNCMWENRVRPSILSDIVFVLREVQRKLPSPKPKLLSPRVKLTKDLARWCLLQPTQTSKTRTIKQSHFEWRSGEFYCSSERQSFLLNRPEWKAASSFNTINLSTNMCNPQLTT